MSTTLTGRDQPRAHPPVATAKTCTALVPLGTPWLMPLFEPIGRTIRRYALAPAADAVRIAGGELGDHAEVLGAAGVVLTEAPRLLAATLTGSPGA